MTFQPVSTASLAAMCATLLISFGLPIALFIILKVRAKARVLPFLLGCVSFVLFAMVLEPMLHNAVLGGPLAGTITSNIWLYGLYGGFAAGLFEETGRYIFMLLVVRRDRRPQNALMYGAGHGGIEAMLLAGGTYINNITYALMINAGQTQQITDSLSGMGAAAESALQSIAGLGAASPGLFLVAGLERVLAIALHIALSVIIYTAVRKKKFGYAVLAFALHMLVDTAAIVINSYASVAVVELAVLVLVVAVGLLALKLYRQAQIEECPRETEAQSEECPPQTDTQG